MLFYSPSTQQLLTQSGLKLDAWRWTWEAADGPALSDLQPVGQRDAVRYIYGARRCRMVPIAIIGPREADDAARTAARGLGTALGSLGVPLLCGGKSGVMEAAAQGALEVGGLTIGFLPDDEWQGANDHIALPLATGIGVARNVLIARSALALVAIGGHYGTMTEVAFGLHFDKPVFGLAGAPEIDGVRQLDSVEAVVDALLPILLRLPDLS